MKKQNRMNNMARQRRAEKRRRRERDTQACLKAQRAGFNFSGWGRNLSRISGAIYKRGDEANQRLMIMNAMTNWQRNQCLRACKGQPARMKPEQLAKYLVLERRPV